MQALKSWREDAGAHKTVRSPSRRGIMHLIYHPSLAEPDASISAEEIEVTPEMIEAGVLEFASYDERFSSRMKL